MVLFWGVSDIFGFDRHAVNNLVREAQRGDENARDRLIFEFQIFIKKVVSKNSTGYEEIDSREEYSVGLMAFNEAIDGYKAGLRSFQSFAAEVIRRRIIDCHRSRSSYRVRNLYILDEEKFAAMPDSANPAEQVHIKMEIEAFVKSLSKYNISLRELMKETPKHADSRLLCIRIARIINSESVLQSHFEKYKTIPVKMLLEKININKKTLERHRKYIIAICLVLMSNLETMREYVENLGRDGDSNAG